MPLKIKVYPSMKDKFKQIQLVEDGLFPKAFCSWLLIGKTGSGKTMVLVNLLLGTDEDPMFKGFYHTIIYMSPTAKSDSIVGQLKLSKENVFDDAPDYSTDVHECVEVLETIMKAHPSVSVQLKAHTADWLCAIEDDESKTYISEYAETLAIACCKAILIWCARFPMTVSAREYEYDDEDEKQW